ncbi:Glutamate or tyrosine decarboxylase [Microbulbifer thermotolerans]|uniref:pyridoxal phosphate-dependent decarboxylase family protein n=1 Tax=Microbulbifer thermotolerans TaxID=252514 RepID=UPI0008E37C08|nr:pyridoxal-dependent decarboxylase [Microbulbifer thermotolerans]SFC84485.1 Glutamate or tyrosine decarboxylase [Microbulbifer thermotolerans]
MSEVRKEVTQFRELLEQALEVSCEFLRGLERRPAACIDAPPLPLESLPRHGMGTAGALKEFQRRVMPYLSGSAGPRYWGFVTGGSSPAALVGDWLAAATDQNSATFGDSIAPVVEVQVLNWLRQLFSLPPSFDGCLTSGATSANLLGILCGRQFAGRVQGMDIAAEGVSGASIQVFSACPHASSLKGLAMAGLGRNNLTAVACEPGTERMDTVDLARALCASDSPGKIVLASAGTVTGTDFDDLTAIASLCRKYNAWLHVDGAFGLFSRLLEDRRHWTEGIEAADSITCDAHKWLNVPYDSGIFLTRHTDLLEQVLAVPSPYLPAGNGQPHFMNRGVENSRRFRALALWFNLRAYGREGVAQIVKDNCLQAAQLSKWLASAQGYDLLVPCKLNVVVFRPRNCPDIRAWLDRLNRSGEVFMTPGQWDGRDAIRAAFSNWSTTNAHVQRVIRLLENKSD